MLSDSDDIGTDEDGSNAEDQSPDELLIIPSSDNDSASESPDSRLSIIPESPMMKAKQLK